MPNKGVNGTVERTNLHLHGSHVSPGKSDNVMIAVENGESQEYEYKIPENHPSGLLWMHVHLHGSTSLSWQAARRYLYSSCQTRKIQII